MIRRLLLDKTDRVSIQLVRYAFVGGLAFAVDFSSLFVLTDLFSVHYLLSAAVAFVLGVSTNYGLSILWVFKTRSSRSRWAEAGIFCAIGIIGLGLNELLMWTFTEWARFHYLASKAVATAATFAWNFIARKVVLFSQGAHYGSEKGCYHRRGARRADRRTGAA